MAERPWVGGYSYSKNERLKLRNEEIWERIGGRESKTLTREKSHSNEIGSIWKVCFFGTQMHIHWPHLITDHQSETERAWEGGRQQSHMKGAWDYIFHFSTALVNHQKSSSLESSTCFFSGLLSGFYQRHFVLIEKGLNRILDAICDGFFFFFLERKWCWGHSSTP